MGVLMTASTILALLALTGAAPVCEELVKPLSVEDLTPIMGKWWFLVGFCDLQMFTDILKVVNSSWITLTPSGQDKTFILSQGNMINGRCEFSSVNTTLKSSVLHANQIHEGFEVTTEVTILSSSSDYLTMKLKHAMAGTASSSVYLFGRSGKLSDTELQAFYKQAECLGYSSPAPYIYNGVTELCDQAQHKLMCEPLVKPQEIKDLTGRWVFLMGFVDNKMFIDLLKTYSSSWMALTPTSQTDTFTISQGSMLNGTCLFSSAQATISNNTLLASDIFQGHLITTEGWALPSSTDTLVIRFRSRMGGQNIHSVYMFGRTGKASATDVEAFQKQAECLGWINAPHYTYDGVTEFCEKSPDSVVEKSVE